jgi:hypothetical protein
MDDIYFNRRRFLRKASFGALGLAAITRPFLYSCNQSFDNYPERENAYNYRIAYGCWINDMRIEPLPLEDWPAPIIDDETLSSLVKALDLQSKFKYNYLDVWGLLATKSWPLNLGYGIDKERILYVKRIIKEAHNRGIKIIYGMGTYSWGYEKIIENNPSLSAKNRDGSLNKTGMCDANPNAFQWVKNILDFVLTDFDFDGIHLESFDQGGCFCKECAGKEGIVEYHSRINSKTADYIRSNWPDKIINVIPIRWAMDSNERFTEAEKKRIIELSKHIDGFYDQGWHGTYIPSDERASFINQLHCVYGTSGGRWLYPGQRWDRESFFIPHIKQQSVAIKEQFSQGVRGLMHYQGPVSNPGTEVNIACGGLMSYDTTQNIMDVLSQVIETLYKPKKENSLKKLVQIFSDSEDAYFCQWGDAEERFRKLRNTGPPGEFYLDNLFGDSPGPASYLTSQIYLDSVGRLNYKKALISILAELQQIEEDFNDKGRIRAIKRSMIITLTILNSIMHSKGEPLE